MKSLLGILSLSILFVTFSSAEIINVPSDIDSIQGGIDIANEGDTVIVDVGTYFENILVDKKNITVGSRFLITNDKSYITKTIIDGNNKSRVVELRNLDSTSILIGFTIKNGNSSYGGGIYCSNSYLTLSDLIIKENIGGSGGGIYFYNSSPVLYNVTITENTAEEGGGISFLPNYKSPLSKSYSKPKFDSINRCNIFNNYAEHGSDLYSYQDSLIKVVVDTFTVFIPDSSQVYPLDKFTFDIKNMAVTSIGNRNLTLPQYVNLKQNYPNPFNPSTDIEFTLPKSEFVELKIYNIMGKEVSTLISTTMNQGNHTYTFDGKNLASGIYYYQLVGGDYREVKKMILLR